MSSYSGLVDARISASDKDLPVKETFHREFKKVQYKNFVQL